jgi:single-stranded-DNA-specific exonuclease
LGSPHEDLTMRRVWEWQVAPEIDAALQRTLQSQLELPPLALRLLVNRGLSEIGEISRFLHPSISDLYDPFLMLNMDRAAARVLEALRRRERIMVYGDYDVDGITAVALLYLVISQLGGDIVYFIPNRLEAGYGVSRDGILEAERQGVTLIVSVDCGITAVEEVGFAQSRGIDFIVTDHHEAAPELPPALAILNPKQSGDTYPASELSGVGVAYKLAQALYERTDQPRSALEDHLDLVALGTAADIVPLVGENRIFAHFGMKQIGVTRKPGLQSLSHISGLMDAQREISPGQVIFGLAPRLNAAGRLGDSSRAVQLLITRDEETARQIARELDEENKRRKAFDEQTLREALAKVESEVDLESDRIIVLDSDRWHPGVIGIVASRLVETYHLPTILVSVEGDEGKGSARSIPAFHLTEALRQCHRHLIKYGGHKYAAGLSIRREDIPAFRQQVKEVARTVLVPDDLVRKLVVDAEIDLHAIDDEFLAHLELFAPFGPHNTRPVFVSRGLKCAGAAQCVGPGHKHLRLRVRQERTMLDSIGFGFGDLAAVLNRPDVAFDLAYVPEYNYWQGQKRIQLRIRDIHTYESGVYFSGDRAGAP